VRRAKTRITPLKLPQFYGTNVISVLVQNDLGRAAQVLLEVKSLRDKDKAVVVAGSLGLPATVTRRVLELTEESIPVCQASRRATLCAQNRNRGAHDTRLRFSPTEDGSMSI
jgi:hypothetical protein